MFLAAVLHSAGYSAEVRIRNMSASGARLEAAIVPKEGAAFQLLRGGLSVSGQVVWALGGKCGVRFKSLVSVREWLAPPRNSEQQRVDDIVRLVKAGATSFPISHQSRPEQASDTDTSDRYPIVDGLERVSALLEKLADTLLSNEETLANHGEEIQNLDICNQTIEAVIDALVKLSPGACQRLQSLSASCNQALEKDQR